MADARPGAGRRRADDDSDRPADPDEFAATIEGTGSEVEPATTTPATSPRKRKRR